MKDKMAASFTSDPGIIPNVMQTFDKKMDMHTPLKLKVQPTLPAGSDQRGTHFLNTEWKKPVVAKSSALQDYIEQQNKI